jgi:hypothetical protein
MNAPGQGHNSAAYGQEPRTCFEILYATFEEEWDEPVYAECELTDAPFDPSELEPEDDDGFADLGELEYALYVIDRDEAEAEEARRQQKVLEALGEPRPKWQARKPICNKLRWRVFRRDNYRCKHCSTDEDLTADHIIADSLGGPTIIENLQTLCRSCNSKKGAR